MVVVVVVVCCFFEIGLVLEVARICICSLNFSE